MIKQLAANLQFFPVLTYHQPLPTKINRISAGKSLAGRVKRMGGEGIK
jgi:hypothetical protein